MMIHHRRHNRIRLEIETKKVRASSVGNVVIIPFSLGKQKWVPLPLDAAEGDGTVAPAANTETQAKTSPSKGTPRTSRSSRGGRGGHRHRTRSLDGLVAKRNRKNRPTAAAQQAYQEYQSYYCKC
jgi:hypothetical protein